jgi:hypothetical protein
MVFANPENAYVQHTFRVIPVMNVSKDGRVSLVMRKHAQEIQYAQEGEVALKAYVTANQGSWVVIVVREYCCVLETA